MYRRLLIFCLLLTLIGSISACQPPPPPNSGQSTSGIGGNGGIDPRFREFYDLYGGKDTLGIAISPKFSQNGVEYQYTAAALMAYNPSAERSSQFYFAPIGIELGIADPPTDPGQPGGHKIYQGFVGIYERMGGSKLVGTPLTDVKFNEERGGIEQHFENLGFYQLESDTDLVKLIHYGAWMCASACNFQSDPGSIVMEQAVVEEPFAQSTSRLNPSFTGKPLTEPFIASDGRVEQIFENVVVVEASDRPGGIALRPITAMLGVPVQNGAQFEIPGYFMELINQNSGLELSGPPVTEYTRQSDEVYRQCFANLCLDYFPNKANELKVRPTALGYLYESKFYESGSVTSPPTSAQTITMRVSKGYNLVAPTQSQIINVFVYNNNQPNTNVQPTLYLMLPGGETNSFSFPPTNSSGRSSLHLEPISAAHGTRVDYQVCVVSEICLEDHFLIWGNP